LEDPDVDRRIILRLIFRTWFGGYGQDWSGSGKGQVAGTGKYGNEQMLSIKSRGIT
jgi:hypothetical protein